MCVCVCVCVCVNLFWSVLNSSNLQCNYMTNKNGRIFKLIFHIDREYEAECRWVSAIFYYP